MSNSLLITRLKLNLSRDVWRSSMYNAGHIYIEYISKANYVMESLVGVVFPIREPLVHSFLKPRVT